MTRASRVWIARGTKLTVFIGHTWYCFPRKIALVPRLLIATAGLDMRTVAVGSWTIGWNLKGNSRHPWELRHGYIEDVASIKTDKAMLNGRG